MRHAVRVGAFLLCLACALGAAADASGRELSAADRSDHTGEPLWSLEGPVGPIEYRAGRGLRLERIGLNIGGFSSLEISGEQNGPGAIGIEGINFLVLLEPLERLRAFAEIELGELLLFETDRGGVRSHPEVDIERLYGDLGLNDRLNLRFGKFLTPVGRWNLVPAEPFVWTASEPVLTERAFEEQQTGAMLFGSFYPSSRTLSYSLYGQFLDPLDVDPDPPPIDHSAGGRLEYGDALGSWSVGTSFLASERDGDWNYLGGIDGEWRSGPLEVTAEFAYAGGDIEGRDLWGFYVQAVCEVLPKFHLVGRYEHFDPSRPERAVDLGDVGVAWVPLPYLYLKASYRFADHETDDVARGIMASLSLLF